MSHQEELFKERVVQFISHEEADILICECKERSIGNFFSSTPSDDFTAEEFDQFMQANGDDWSLEGFSFVDAYEGEMVGTMQNKMDDFYTVQLKAVVAFIEMSV
jgi:hypothetical protein